MLGVKEAVLTNEIILVARELPLHQVASDRMIAATAPVLDLTLVTADTRLLSLRSIKTLANSSIPTVCAISGKLLDSTTNREPDYDHHCD